MKVKTALANAAILAVSVVLSVLLAEVLARMALNPADYLSVDMVHDDVLGAVPSTTTGSSQFDRWGFRNREVPDTAEIVAIGDSHTYGNAATMDDSWPYVLGRLSGKRVYNMAMGGYGPNQYYDLFLKALTLKPKTIVVGLYMGDDFENAYLITYGLEHWSYLRTLPNETINFDIWERPAAPTWHKRLRIWLSQHSVLYQLVFHGPLLGRAQGEFQIKNAHALSDVATTLSVPEHNLLEAFLPTGIRRNVDQSNESIREGMRITFRLLAEMNEMSRKNNIRYVVAVIPTKEMVFADYLEHNRQVPLNEVLDNLLANERVARERTFRFMTDSNIEFVDVLPALRRSVEHELYARTAADMHPNRNGYRVIAEAIFEALGSAR